MRLYDRADAFNTAYSKWPASHLNIVAERGEPVIYGRWVLGNDYRNKTRFYGAYPPGFLDRVLALFPDVPATQTLHVFSGSLSAGEYTRCDLVCDAEYQCNVYELPAVTDRFFELAIADPPYSSDDAARYNTPAINRGRATSALASVIFPAGHLVWLDTCWPMHSKRDWRTVARIAITRSTNHRIRDLTIFERLT